MVPAATIPTQSDVSMATMLIVYAVAETLKVTGVTGIVQRLVMGKRSPLTDKEQDAMNKHYEKCRNCSDCQKQEVELLQKISDTLIRVETRLDN
jgi:hypothetical protein